MEHKERMHTMKKLVVLSALVVLLTACGAAAPAAEPAVAPTIVTAVEPTATAVAEEPTAAATVVPTAESASAPAVVATGARTFVIDPAQSSAQYAVEEIFFSDNRLFTAVGVTNAVEGEFEVTADGKPSGKVTRMRVDLHAQSDSPRRDNAIRRQWFESDTYPYADFVSTDALNLPESYTEGEHSHVYAGRRHDGARCHQVGRVDSDWHVTG
jgi:polyisoprenoid-binding protein YceI